MGPDISVILPVYNGMPYLRESVASVLTQTYKSFELLIADDGSSDGSLEFLENIVDDRVSLLKNARNIGLFSNLNQLIRLAKAPNIKLWSQDDIMYPNCLEVTVAFHRKYPDIGFSYSDRDIIDKDSVVVRPVGVDHTPEYISPSLHDRIALYCGSIAGNIANVTLSGKALQEVGLFNETMRFSGDFEMWVRLTSKFSVGKIGVPLIQLRDHAGQLSRSGTNAVNQLKEDLIIFDKLLKRVPPEDSLYGKKMLRFRRMPYYLSVAALFLRQGKLGLLITYMNVFAHRNSILALLSCGLVGKAAQKLGLERKLCPPPREIQGVN